MTSPAVALFVLPLVAAAHGGGNHLMGSVSSIQAPSFKLETTDNRDVDIGVDAHTKFEKSGTPSS